MDKDRMNEENRPGEELPEAALPEEEQLPGPPEEDLGEALSEEELSAAPAVYEEEAPPLPTVEKKWDKKREKKSRIPKRWRPLIWAGVIVLVLGLAYAGVRIFFPEEVAEDEGPTRSDYDYLVHYDSSKIDSMKFEFADGYSYEVKLSRSIADTGYTVTSYAVTGKGEYAYDTTAFSNLIAATCSITSANTAVEAPEDLSVYGLAEPAVRVTYTDLDGGQSVVLVGDQAPVGSSYYAMVEGGDRVYVIGSYNADYLLKKDMAYRDLTITSYEDPAAELDRICITRTPEEVIEVRRQTPEELAERGLFATTFQIKQPYDLGVNGVYLEEYVLNHLLSINAVQVLIDRPEDFSAYGLAEEQDPVCIELDNADGTSRRIYLGHVAEDGTVYVRLSGVTSVYTCNPEDFSFINVTYGDLMDFALWTYMINDVKSVEMELDGESHILELANVTDESLDAWLDGEEISEVNARMLYTRVLQIYSYDVLPEGAEPGEVVYSFRINFLDGTDSTLEFARIGERSFAVSRDGRELGLYTRIASFQSVEQGIEDIKTGYTIGHRF